MWNYTNVAVTTENYIKLITFDSWNSNLLQFNEISQFLPFLSQLTVWKAILIQIIYVFQKIQINENSSENIIKAQFFAVFKYFLFKLEL